MTSSPSDVTTRDLHPVSKPHHHKLRHGRKRNGYKASIGGAGHGKLVQELLNEDLMGRGGMTLYRYKSTTVGFQTTFPLVPRV